MAECMPHTSLQYSLRASLGYSADGFCGFQSQAPSAFYMLDVTKQKDIPMAWLLLQSVARPESLCAFNPKHLDKYLSGSIWYSLRFAYFLNFLNLPSTVTFSRVSKWLTARLLAHAAMLDMIHTRWSSSEMPLCATITFILLHRYIPSDGFCQGINRSQLWSTHVEIILEIQTAHLSRVYFSLSVTWLSCSSVCIVTIIVYLILVDDSAFDFASWFLPY